MEPINSQDEIDIFYTLNVMVHVPDETYDVMDFNRLFSSTNVKLSQHRINLVFVTMSEYDSNESWININHDLSYFNKLKDIEKVNFHIVFVDKIGDNKNYDQFTGYSIKLLQHKSNIIFLTSLDKKVLLHELGHTFGLANSTDPNNWMSPIPPLFNFGFFSKEQIIDMRWNLLIENRKISSKNIVLHDNYNNKLIFKKS